MVFVYVWLIFDLLQKFFDEAVVWSLWEVKHFDMLPDFNELIR
jgi:hypothetical protein